MSPIMPADMPCAQAPALIHTIVVAAGVGKRFGGELPKQYTQIQQKTVLEHSIAALSHVPQLGHCYLVVSPNDKIAKTLEYAMPIIWVAGGAERMHSVFNGVTAIWQRHAAQPLDNQWVLIHDAARPCVLATDIQRLIDKTTVAHGRAGGLLAVPVRDTVKLIEQIENHKVAKKTIDRSQLWLAQTPQLFPLAKLYHYLEQAIAQHIPFTDEASLFEHFGELPLLVEGSHSNIKLTYPEDLQFAAVYL